MGTCYSKSGHELDSSNTDKRPKERKKGSQKNGHLGSHHKLKLIVEDFDGVQKDVSDTVYTEDSHTFNGLEVDNLLHKSQQTSLDMLTKDTNRNSETFTVSHSSEQDDVNSSKDINKTCDDNSQEWTVNDQKDHTVDEIVDDMVVASDSGVVLENSAELEQGITLKCDHFGETETHESTFKTLSDGLDKIQCDTAETKQRDTVQSNCLYSNVNDSKPQVKSQSEHSSCNGYHGECQGHLYSKRSFTRMSHVNGSSETLLKSSLKKCQRKPRQKKGLSWKSADSLDYVESMATSLDRTKSVCSSILGDDISLLNAPLATFDSIDYAIGNSYDFSKFCDSKSSNIKNNINGGDSLKLDFSGLSPYHVRQSVGSIDGLSDSYNKSGSHSYTDSTSDLDKLRLAVRHSSTSIQADQWSLSDSLDGNYDLPAVSSQPIRTMTMNGRDVVVIDQELFSQIIDEIQFLKMKLSQLTEVIGLQEMDGTDNSGNEGTSILSSSADLEEDVLPYGCRTTQTLEDDTLTIYKNTQKKIRSVV